MAVRTSVQFTVGRAGSGKSLLRCAKFLSEELLPETNLHHWSNFPYEPRTLAVLAAQWSKNKNGDADEYEARLHRFPEEELAAWRLGQRGPWDFFKGQSLADTHIAIDEIHEYAGVGAKMSYLAQWQKWLGTIRHQGATIEFLSQNEMKVARVIKNESGLRRELVHSDERPDPFFHIELGDWYELRAKLTGTYLAAVWETLGREVNARFIREREKFHYLLPRYFELYDSYSKPESGGGQAGGPRKREYERRSWPGLINWFVSKHFYALLMRSWLLWLPLFFVCGGGGCLVHGIVSGVGGFAAKNMRAALPASQGAGPAGVTDQGVGGHRVTELGGGRYRGGGGVGGGAAAGRPALVDDRVGVVRLVLVRREEVVFEDGAVLRVGETVESGAALGWRLEVVNDVEGVATFDRRGVVRHVALGRDWVPRSAGVAGGAGVPGGVLGSAAGGVGAADTGHGGARFVVSGGHNARAVPRAAGGG